MDTLKAPVNELAEACARSADAREWEEFLRRCAPIATLVARRIARMWLGVATPSVVDDIVQEAFLKLCEQERRILRDFKPRSEDSFFGLLRVVTASVANDYFRRQHSEKRGGKVVTMTLDDDPTSAVAVSTETTAGIHRAVLLGELDEKQRSAPGSSAERDRTIFWLYYLQGLTADEIAALPASDLSAKGVESALRRVTTWLRKELVLGKSGGPIQQAGETAN
jgi:RNA polymerase sigma-70 factor (ECF subfamily)